MSEHETIELPENPVLEAGKAVEDMVRPEYRAPVHVIALLLVAGAAIAAGCLWVIHTTLTLRAEAVEITETTEAPAWDKQHAVDAEQSQKLTDQGKELHQLERDLDDMRGDLRALKDDVHYLRERAERGYR